MNKIYQNMWKNNQICVLNDNKCLRKHVQNIPYGNHVEDVASNN